LRSVPTATTAIGTRTRGLDIGQVADSAEAKAVIDRWNEHPAASRHMLRSPTIRVALIAGTPQIGVHCPRCGPNRAIDLRTVDRLL
jgi:hypothetical protein